MAHILVVEDQKSIVMQVEALLKSRGHLVAVAFNSHDALEQLHRFRIDLVVTDIMMPGGASGFELAKTIKKDQRYTSIPVMIMTGRRDQKDVEKGILSGADDYVVKPLDTDLFLAKIDALLRKRGKQEFTNCTVNEVGRWDMTIDVIGITEVGLEVNSPVALVVGTNVRMDCDIFAKIGIPVPTLHVISCDPIPKTKTFKVKVNFIGFQEKELKPIRMWIRDTLARTAS